MKKETNKKRKTLKQKLEIEWKLLPLNLVILFFYAGIHSLIYYILLHAKALGLTIVEITIISTFSTIISAVAPFITGIIVDKFGNYKLAISIFALACGGIFNLSSAIPIRSSSNAVLFTNKSKIFLFNTTINTINYVLPFWLHENCTEKDCIQANTSITKQDECQFSNFYQPFEHYFPNKTNLNYENCDIFIIHNILWKLKDDNNTDCFYKNDELQTLEKFCSFVNECNGKRSEWTCIEQRFNSSQIEHLASAGVIFDITFISVFVIHVLGRIFIFPIFPLVDTIIWANFKKLGYGKYGRSIMWVTIARTIFPFLSGIILDTTLSRYGPTHFWPVYVLSIGLFLLGIIVILKVNLTEEKIQGSVLRNLREIMKLKHMMFYVIVFIFGFTPGIIATFVPIFLRNELNSPMMLIGIMPSVSSIPAIFVHFFSDNIIKKIGHFNVIAFGFFILGIRLILYSYLWSPWWMIPIEVLKAFSHYLSSVAVFSYGKLITSPGLITTMSAFIRILIYGCGRSTGIALGGIMIENWRERRTFQVLAVGFMVVSVTCIGIQRFYNKHGKKTDVTETDEELPDLTSKDVPFSATPEKI